MSAVEIKSIKLGKESLKNNTLLVPQKMVCQTRSNSSNSDGEEFQNNEENCDKIKNLLMPKIRQSEISSELLAQSVSELLAKAQSKDASMQMKMAAITYFYIYLANFEVQKTRLQSIQTACFMLASKIVRKPSLSFQEIGKIFCIDKKQQILEEEQKIVGLMEWDAWLTFDILSNQNYPMCEGQIQKMNFLVEILLLKNSDPLTKYQVTQKIREASKMQVLQKDYIEINEIIMKKVSQKVIQFYSLRFDVSDYLKNITL